MLPVQHLPSFLLLAVRADSVKGCGSAAKTARVHDSCRRRSLKVMDCEHLISQVPSRGSCLQDQGNSLHVRGWKGKIGLRMHEDRVDRRLHWMPCLPGRGCSAGMHCSFFCTRAKFLVENSVDSLHTVRGIFN